MDIQYVVFKFSVLYLYIVFILKFSFIKLIIKLNAKIKIFKLSISSLLNNNISLNCLDRHHQTINLTVLSV